MREETFVITHRLTRLNASRTWMLALLSLVMLSLGLLPDVWRTTLYFVPQRFEQGQWWLLLSSQFVHLNLLHAVYNIAGLLLVYFLVLTRVSTIHIALCIVSSLLFISFFLMLFPYTYRHYAGFSGVLYGLFFLGSLSLWRQDRLVAGIVLSALVAKLLWDWLGPSAFERVDWLDARVAVEAHAAGVAGAGVFMLICRLYQSLRK